VRTEDRGPWGAWSDCTVEEGTTRAQCVIPTHIFHADQREVGIRSQPSGWKACPNYG